jgi:Ca2+-binding EF-hand superfamily protein
MGNYASNKSEHLIKKKLRNIPYAGPTDRDFDTLVYESNLDRNEVVDIIESHLTTHPDGRMNREEFCDLYSRLKKDSDQKVLGLSENIFKALGVNEIDNEGDLITLREFLMIYAITNKGDLSKKLEYVVEKYDVHNTQSLDIEEAKEIIQIILDILKPNKETQSTSDIVRDCFKQMKIIQVVKKG